MILGDCKVIEDMSFNGKISRVTLIIPLVDIDDEHGRTTGMLVAFKRDVRTDCFNGGFLAILRVLQLSLAVASRHNRSGWHLADFPRSVPNREHAFGGLVGAVRSALERLSRTR